MISAGQTLPTAGHVYMQGGAPYYLPSLLVLHHPWKPEICRGSQEREGGPLRNQLPGWCDSGGTYSNKTTYRIAFWCAKASLVQLI